MIFHISSQRLKVSLMFSLHVSHQLLTLLGVVESLFIPEVIESPQLFLVGIRDVISLLLMANSHLVYSALFQLFFELF